MDWKFSKGMQASSFLSFVFVILLLQNVINVSNAVQLQNSKHSNKTSKVPSIWRLDSGSKSFPDPVATKATSSPTCQTPKKCQKLSKQKHKLKKSQNQSVSLPPTPPQSLLNVSQITPENIHEMNKFMREKGRFCKLRSFKGLSCQKFKFTNFLAKQLRKPSTKLGSWLELTEFVPNNNSIRSFPVQNPSDLNSMSWPEKIVYRLVKSWGGPEDLFVFYKFKDYITSRELKVSLPLDIQLKVAPKTENEERTLQSSSSSSSLESQRSLGTPRFFLGLDPGFNLKLKFPFAEEELKIAVSSGGSFLIGIAVGALILFIKGLIYNAIKFIIFKFFIKDSFGTYDFFKKVVFSHSILPQPEPELKHYRPPKVHNHYDSRPPKKRRRRPRKRPRFRHHHPHPPEYHQPPPPKYHHPSINIPQDYTITYDYRDGHKRYSDTSQTVSPVQTKPAMMFSSPFEGDPNELPPFDFEQQQSFESSPVVRERPKPTMNQLETLYRDQLKQGGLSQEQSQYKSMFDYEALNEMDGYMDSFDRNFGQKKSSVYVPSTGLQAEVEHYDPFYSPLLSKIDSIFTHLGHISEGCRERVVCSAFKFPVKYSPYSNLLSVQLSKHQSELKKPISSSARILRYFRYMKAGKDGQNGKNCLDMYPKCGTNTDSNFPMAKTFTQLSELMTAESSYPAVFYAARG